MGASASTSAIWLQRALLPTVKRHSALAPLVALLSHSSAGVTQRAALVLRNLAVESDVRKDKIILAGALKPLVAVLSRPSAAAAEQAAGVLSNLAFGSHERKTKINALRPLPPSGRCCDLLSRAFRCLP